MTPRDARRAGESWAISCARVARFGPEATGTVYAVRYMAAYRALAEELQPAMREAFDTEYLAETARLEGGRDDAL